MPKIRELQRQWNMLQQLVSTSLSKACKNVEELLLLGIWRGIFTDDFH
ncbi:MAG: hypothetical protein ACTS8R_03095 [Arsenophonus sp. NC-QC1-MAG3]